MLHHTGHNLTLDEPPVRFRRVTIEVTTWCNLDCPGCLRTNELAAGRWRNRNMPVETFSRIVENIPPSDMLVMHGVGEPTLHPDYLELISIARRSGKFDRIHCNTNAMARDEQYYLQMVLNGLNSFSVSVDTLDPELIRLTRAGTDLDRLFNRLKAFHRLELPFYIQMVASKINYNDIFFTLYTLNKIGHRTVFIQPFIDIAGSGNALPKNQATMFIARIRSLSSQFANLSIHASAFCNTNIGAHGSGEPLCLAPWLDPGIDVDGFLTPCCMHWCANTLGLCNIADISFSDAWHSKPLHDFLEAYLENPPEFCRCCYENRRGL